MAKLQGQGGGGKGPRNTRVYAPTHQTKKNADTDKQHPTNDANMQAGGTSLKTGHHQETKNKRQPQEQEYMTVQFAVRDKEMLARHAQKEQNNQRKRAEDGSDHRKQTQQKTKSYESIHRLEPMKRTPQKTEPKKGKRPISKRRMLNMLIAGVVVIALFLAGYFVFLLEEIVVEGNETYASSSIITLSALTPGKHMLLNSIEDAKTNLQSNPYIKVIEIEREFPRTIRITMQERKEAAAILLQGVNVIIDIEGYVLSIGGSNDLSDLIQIYGMSQLGFQANQQLGPGSDMQVQSLISLLKNLQDFALIDEIVSIDLSNPLRLTMETKQGILIILGQSDGLEGKFQWMRDALPSLQMDGVEGSMLDVSAKGGAIYMPPDQGMQGSISLDGDDEEEEQGVDNVGETQNIVDGEELEDGTKIDDADVEDGMISAPPEEGTSG